MIIDVEELSTGRGIFAIRRGRQRGGTPVLCLHGFPDDASTFDQLADSLQPYGYDVMAMYLRGYHPSVLEGPYDLGRLVDDVLAVLDATGYSEPVHLVGHDYGAQIAFAALAHHPNRFRAAVTLAGAHPSAITKNMPRHPRQAWLSRYIIFFQFGRLADQLVRRNSFEYIGRLWRRWSPNWTADPVHLAHVKATIAASMPAPIAMYRGGGFDLEAAPITVPTLFITGEDDRCSLPQMSNGQDHLFDGHYERQIWPDTGHFPHLEHPEKAADSIRSWFARRE